MIVEPYAYLKDEQYLTLTHQRWQLILPGPLTEAHVPPRSIIHVNTHISSMSYFITPFPSRDISLISLLMPNSQKTLTLVNVYNPPTTFTTIPTLTELIDLHPSLFGPRAAFVFMGDFNLHHSLWNDPALEQYNHHEAESLLEIMANMGAQLRSQPMVHTFHNSQGASSVIDLVFTSAAADLLYEACITSHDPEFDHGLDHFPILH